MARLTFNTAAAREYFESNRLNWLRLRIERGVITLRPAAHARGDEEVIKIERRPRGIVAEIDEGRFSKRLMTRLFRAGLSEDQPYFLLASAPYGWIGIDHLPGMKPPQRQAVMVVSNFETPDEVETPPARAQRVPVNTFDMAQWQRFLRAVNANRPIEASGWDDIRQMIMLAQELTGQKQRGRQSFARIAAIKLLAAVQRRAPALLAWEERHPELRRQVTTLLKELGIPVEQVPADVIHIHTRRRGRPHRPTVPTIEVENVTVDEVVISDDRTGQPEVTAEQVVEEAEQVVEEEAEQVVEEEAEQVVEEEPEDLPPPPPRRPRRRSAVRRGRNPFAPPELESPAETETEATENPFTDNSLQQKEDILDEDIIKEPEPIVEEREPILTEASESSDGMVMSADEPEPADDEPPEPEVSEPVNESADDELSHEAEASEPADDEPPEPEASDPEPEASEPEPEASEPSDEMVADNETIQEDETVSKTADPEAEPESSADHSEQPEAHHDGDESDRHPGEDEQPEIDHRYRQHVDTE